MTDSNKKKQVKNGNTASDETETSDDSHELSNVEPENINEVIQYLEKLPKDELKKVIRRVSVERSMYSGPIPPPEILEGYEKVLPGTADRIMKMAEKQADHRRNMEETTVNSGARDSKLGIICGTFVCFSLIVVGGISVMIGSTSTGTVLSLSGLAPIVTAFIYGTRSNANERKEKRSSGDLTEKKEKIENNKNKQLKEESKEEESNKG